MANSIDRPRLQRLLARRLAQEEQKPTISPCGKCEHAFEQLQGFGDYVCDIDAEPIKLHLERVDCPQRNPVRIPMKEAA